MTTFAERLHQLKCSLKGEHDWEVMAEQCVDVHPALAEKLGDSHALYVSFKCPCGQYREVLGTLSTLCFNEFSDPEDSLLFEDLVRPSNH